MKVAKLVIVFGISLALAANAQAQSLVADISSPGDVATGVADLVLGYEFQVNSPVTVTGLADFEPTAGGNAVGLWDASRNLLATATVSSSDPSLGNGFFNYAPVPSMTLAPGIYYVGAELDGLDGSDAPYTWDAGGLTTIPQISDMIPAYGFGSGLTFPENPDGGATFAYFGGNVVVDGTDPTPDGGTTILLLGLAFIGLAIAHRKYRGRKGR